MDKTANQIDASVYTLVLRKLKHILVSGYYGMDEVRYQYDWDDTPAGTLHRNLGRAAQEDAALRYFLSINVIDGRRIENEFKRQQFHGNVTDKQLGVWGKAWDEADPAYREFDWIVLIYSMNADKFVEQCHIFGLVDAGIGLTDINNSTTTNLPKLVLDAGGGFTVHLGGLIAYEGREVDLQRQECKIAAHIIENAASGQYTSLDSIADNCLSEAYLEKAGMSGDEGLVHKYLWRCLYDIRAAFKSAAATDKDYFPLKRGIGYTFSP